MSVKEITVVSTVELSNSPGLIDLLMGLNLRSREDIVSIRTSPLDDRKYIADAQLVVNVCLNNRKETDTNVVAVKILRAVTHCVCEEISEINLNMVLETYRESLDNDIKKFTKYVYNNNSLIIRDDSAVVSCVLDKNMNTDLIFEGKKNSVKTKATTQ